VLNTVWGATLGRHTVVAGKISAGEKR
jgi:hypothetical protein